MELEKKEKKIYLSITIDESNKKYLEKLSQKSGYSISEIANRIFNSEKEKDK